MPARSPPIPSVSTGPSSDPCRRPLLPPISAAPSADPGLPRRPTPYVPSLRPSSPLQQAEVAVELELGHLRRVLAPLRPLVADEPLEDVVAEGLGQQLGGLHETEGLLEVAGKGLDARVGELCRAEVEEVGIGLRWQRVALLDALQAGEIG